MPEALSYELHKLAARLDSAADGLLRSEAGVSYSRFLALFAVGETGGSQRDLARWLGLTEPSTSRMVGVLAGDGLLIVARLAGAGNRRQLQLTDEGARLVERYSHMLEDLFADLVRRSGVPFATYQRHTRRLLAQLDSDQQEAAMRSGAA
ncbi:MAG: MarR family transcriptional regulator [Streptosporangiaceae bacterium]|jgi:DNA-binding MarR family transcriptional regulator